MRIIKEFFVVQKRSSWSFHVQTVEKMVNFFAASECLNYKECSRFYIQKMERGHGFGEIACNLWKMGIGNGVGLISENARLISQIIELRSRIWRIVKKSITFPKSEILLI